MSDESKKHRYSVPLEFCFNIKEPTKSQGSGDTIVVVGAGAGGAAAAFKLPEDTVDQSGEGVSSDPVKQDYDRVLDGSQNVAVLKTDTVRDTASESLIVSSAPVSSSEERNGLPGAATTSSSGTAPLPDEQRPEVSLASLSSGQDVLTSEQLTPPMVSGSLDQQKTLVNQEHSQQVVSSSSVVQPAAGEASEEVSKHGGDEIKFGTGSDNKETSGSQAGSSAQSQGELDLSHMADSLDSRNTEQSQNPSSLPPGVGGMAVEPVLFSADTSKDGGELRNQEKSAGNEPSAEAQSLNPEGEGDFPTFDKWSVQYLAEQEKQKIEKEQEQAVKPGAQLSQKKLRQNFAAEGCGAKVVSSNVEAENVNFLLNGNPDEYMISPCKAKKWFVVELCEPVQIHKVELGTLELFSSPPKSFRVASSQRFPTKDWAPIGQFEMTPDRSVQSFHTQVSEEFVKFLRVEMLEHHGKEHYCPLTTLRVLGIDMALDDDEDHDTGDVEGHDAEHTDTGDGMDGAVSLFNSAKETVVKLVQKVLYTGEKEEAKEDAAKDNATKSAEKEESVQQETTPCPIKDSGLAETGATATATIPPSSDEASQTAQPGSGEQQTVKQTVTTETPIITKLADTEQLPMEEKPVVVKLAPEEGDTHLGQGFTSQAGLLTKACPYSSLHPFYSMVGQGSLAAPSLCSTGVPARKMPKHRRPQKDTSATKLETTHRSEGGIVHPEGAEDMAEEQSNEGATAQRLSDVGKSAECNTEPGTKSVDVAPGELTHTQTETQTVESPAQVKRSESGSGLQTPPTEQPGSMSTVASEENLSTGTSQVFMTSGSTTHEQPQPVLEPSSVVSTPSLDQGGAAMSSATSTPGLDIGHSQMLKQPAGPDLTDTMFLKVDPSPTLSDGVSADHIDLMSDAAPTATTESPLQDSGSSPGSSTDQDATGRDQLPPQSANVSEPAAGVGRSGRAADLVKVGMPSSKRDASFMKLNNRIIALEQNVSMTKKYLEELSRAFKQQSEEMMKLINKSDSRINGLVARSEERDLVLQTAILVLEQKVANLTQVVDLMQLQIDALAKELWKSQVFLGMMQLLAFLWLFTNSATGVFSRVPGHASSLSDPVCGADSHSKSLPGQDRVKSEGEKNGSSELGLRRRNSDGNLKSHAEIHSAVGVVNKPKSELDLSSVAASAEESSKEMFAQNPKKKKKKKQRQSQMVLDGSGSLLPGSVDITPVQSPSFSSSAGVLFGTSSTSTGTPDLSSNQSALLAESAITTKAPVVTVGETKENSPVGVPSPALSVWPGIRGCRVCGDLQQGLPNPWPYRLPAVGQPGICQAHAMPTLAPWGHVQFHHNMTPVGPALMPAMTSFSSNVVTSPQPFLDLSNSPHQACIPTVQLSPPQISEALQSSSPEFKLPAYRRSKIRRLSGSEDSGPTEHGQSSHHHKAVARRNLMVPESRRRKSDFINPNPWQEFFLAKNYLSENRFKFPASPSRDSISPESCPDDPLKDRTPAVSSRVSTSSRDGQDGSAQPLSGASVTPASPHTPDSVAFTRFHPSTPSFIPLHQTSSIPSSNSSRTIPSPPSLPLHSQHDQPGATYESLKAGDQRRKTLSLDLPQHNEQTSSTHKTSGQAVGGKKPPTAPKKTHRRQGSYPLDQANSAPQGANHLNQATQGPKSDRLASSSQPQGELKLKKASASSGGSGNSKKSFGAKPAVPHATMQVKSRGSNQMKLPSGPSGSAVTVCEASVTGD
ncbi:sun domain-containing ossification factor-like [Plakobranchus ocellatus]|uniref:Sun domain-containing ossification factor-like n=1 Tax=Plakobranchus ocellatus TaxID=259542 RepID=A0AAV4D6S5_9GAST|nr:sun domain-containing ossification factor-like [Plakobranchus ocellatus]